MAALYRQIPGERILTDFASAEFAKYVDNSWHALKVVFANEIARLTEAFGGNPEITSRIFLSDAKLNLSAAYLKPGAPFGGSCLPKDVRGLNHLAREYGLRLPVMQAIMPGNDAHTAGIVQQTIATGARCVGVLGLAFKPGVDDLRESPALAVAKALRMHGITLLAHDDAFPPGMEIPLPDGGSLTITTPEAVAAQAQALLLFHALPHYLAVTNATAIPVIRCTMPTSVTRKLSPEANA